jgi:glycosyltransferase involved in cell wall biosynthesis
VQGSARAGWRLVGSGVVPPGEIALAALLAIIPALDEEETVAQVVRAVLDHLDADVLVVDDGSRDDTVGCAVRAGAIVLSHPFNLGVGAALRTGFRYAQDRSYAVVVQIDGDGQHEVADAKRLVEAVTDGGADLAVGSRFGAGYDVSRLRRTSMRLLSRRVSRYLGVTITDTTSGFRAFSAAAVDRFATAYPTAYLSDTVEALLLARDLGFTVTEVGVQMHARQGGAPSSNSLRSLYHFLRLWLVLGLHRFRRPLLRAELAT